MPATEMLRAPLKPGSKPRELLRITDTLPAVGKVFLGYVSGSSNMVRAFLDWDSIEAHQAFHTTAAFPPFLDEFHNMVAGEFSLWHVDFKPSLEAQHKAQSAPVTEVATFYFAGEPQSGFVDAALRFREVLAQQPGFVEMALGVTHEEVSFDGEKGHTMVILVGWETEQQWQTFANSQEYKEKNPGRRLEEGVLRKFDVEVVSLEPV